MKTIFLALGLILFGSQSQFVAQTTANNKPAAPKVEQEKSDLPASELIAQGKALYRTARFKQAMAKFDAALKQEPDNDEALGLAAETAFRLDSQAAAREHFLKRAGLSGQKDSVKAYSYHRAAMTCWREAHDLVAKYIEIKNGKVANNLPESTQQEVSDIISNGIEYATGALNLRSNFADAYNIRNLLHAEAALAANDETMAKNSWQKSLDDVRMALAMAKPSYPDRDSADFNFPTVRISEFARTKEEQEKQTDEMVKIIEGGKPVKRVQAIFPATRPAAKPVEPGSTVTKNSVSPGKVKVEVLISTEGKVIFSHIVDGRSDLNSAAILAARAWTFEPALLDGQPVQVSGVISFDLKPVKPAATAPTNSPAKKP
ncbi:MAG: TonB family protein [Acidobacteriota bacterium]|nr:TonB family protein [Acidobacteriota bacterium]